jgi:preprotein translocase subunit SecA
MRSLGIESNITTDSYQKVAKPQLQLFDDVFASLKEAYKNRSVQIGEDVWKSLERNIFLDIMDHRWKEHLYAMDHLRDGIWAVGYGEKNPLVEYKLQGFRMFDAMVESLKQEIITFLFRVEVTENIAIKEESKEYRKIGEEHHQGMSTFGNKSNGGGILPGSSPSELSTKPKVSVSVSAGGASERKSSRRNKRG